MTLDILRACYVRWLHQLQDSDLKRMQVHQVPLIQPVLKMRK
jgi:hypothetical protein